MIDRVFGCIGYPDHAGGACAPTKAGQKTLDVPRFSPVKQNDFN
jgi:AMMECR1 domain-containing protein